MAIELTKRQEQAIAAKGSVVVYAAAGSGKTAVLTKRAVELLKDKQNVTEADRMLIVTYTNAAAAELRTRINEELYAAISEDPCAHLLRQEMLISAAPICTIDSFCSSLLRENFQYASISPDFKSASNEDAHELGFAVIRDMVAEKYAVGDRSFIELASNVGIESDLQTFSSAVLSVYESSRSMPFPERWLEDAALKYSSENGGLGYWQGVFLSDVKDKLSRCAAMLDTAIREISVEVGLLKYLPAFESGAAAVNSAVALAEKNDYDGVCNIIDDCKVNIRVTKTDADPDTVEYMKRVRSAVNDVLKKISADMKKSEENARDLELTAALVRSLVDFVKEFGERFRAELISKNTLTFDMIEHIAFSLVCELGQNGELIPTEIGRALIKKFKYVMVDEYQDTNGLQDAFFKVISDNGKNLFMVGDAKQSIYGFRHANPLNFIHYRDTYPSYFEGSDRSKVVLDANFRSRSGICDFTNFIFSLIMKKKTSEMDYTADDEMDPQATYTDIAEPSVEIHPVDSSSLSSSAAGAGRIAALIRNTMAREPFLKDKDGGLRAATYSDFVILIRSAKTKGGEYMKKLREEGIPVSFSTDVFAETTEISAVISLLGAIDNPTRDVHLLAALTGPVFCLTPDTIARARAGNKKEGSIYSSLVLAAKQDKAVSDALSTLSTMRRRASSMTVSEFLRDLYEVYSIPEIMSSIGEAERRYANLQLLLELADEYDSGEHAGLSGFLRYFERISKKGAKAEGDTDAVRIMTVHSSKGLQFPICILAECSASFNTEEQKKPVLMNEKAGISLNLKSISDYTKTVPISSKVIKNEMLRSEIAEEQRLLYVALTRAQEKLVLLVDKDDFYKKLQKYSVELDAAEAENRCLLEQTVLSARSYTDWIAMSVLLHTDMKDTDYCLKTYGKSGTFIINEDEYDLLDKKESFSLQKADQELANELKERFLTEYSYSASAATVSKTTVSQILQNESAEKYGFSRRPAILSVESMSGAERGTALHKFMQYSDIAAARKNVEAEISRLYEWEYISEAEANSLDRKAIEAFLNSPLCKEMMSAAFILKEQRFILPFTDEKGAETVIQGAIDCVYEKDGGIVVVDFKTTRYDTAEQLISAYSSQLEIYARAISEITGLKVQKKYIYSLHLSKAVEL